MTVYMLFAEIFLIVLYTGYCKFIEKRPLSSMGFTKRNMSSFYAKGDWLECGFDQRSLSDLCIDGACHFEGVSVQLVPGYVIFYLIGYMIQGLAEEVICRGYLLVSLSRRNSVWYSVILSSGVFMAMHMSNEHVTVLAYINLFCVDCCLVFCLWKAAVSGRLLHCTADGISCRAISSAYRISGTAKSSSVFDSFFADGWSFMNGGDLVWRVCLP